MIEVTVVPIGLGNPGVNTATAGVGNLGGKFVGNAGVGNPGGKPVGNAGGGVEYLAPPV